jgi:hypothetical protein
MLVGEKLSQIAERLENNCPPCGKAGKPLLALGAVYAQEARANHVAAQEHGRPYET